MSGEKRAAEGMQSPSKSQKTALSFYCTYVFVHDMDRAFKFYTETLGLKERFRMGNDWAEVDLGGVSIGLHPVEKGVSDHGRDRPASSPSHGGTISIAVDGDIEAFAAGLRAKGVKFDAETLHTGPRGKTGSFQDTEGNWLYLMEPYRGPSHH